jgi:hypothetical protein
MNFRVVGPLWLCVNNTHLSPMALREFFKKNRIMMAKLFTFKNGSYNREENGLFGEEDVVLRGLFNDIKTDNTPKQFDKLTGLQKKVIRKMGWPKEAFLNPKKLNRIGK